MSPDQGGGARSDVLLVGSLPFDTAEEAMRAAGSGLHGHVGWMPDGEVAERINWVGMLPLVVFPKTPGLEETMAPPEHELEQPDKDADQPPVEDLPGIWNWRIKPGEKVRFDDLAYGTYAVESYAVMKRLRDEGAIPADIRFQMCLPAPHSAIDGFLEDNSQWPELYAAYVKGIRGEIEKALDVIPADDLVIQWDAAWEFVDMAMGERNYFKFWPKLSAEEKFQRHAEQLDELWQGIPNETLLGYHWCYGTWGGWPMTAMEDLALCVRLSNETVANADRKIDYVHMPVVRHPGPDFFTPLDDLDIGDTKVYLGLIHHTDGVDGNHERIEAAREHLADFGIGSVCGYGRVDPAELPVVLDVHASCARDMRAA